VGVLSAVLWVSFKKLARMPREGSMVAVISLAAAPASLIVHQLTYYPALGNQGTAVLTWFLYATLEAFEPVYDQA
jgi:hypothetical protein